MYDQHKWKPHPETGPGWEINQNDSRRWIHGEWIIETYGDRPFPLSPDQFSVHTKDWSQSLDYDPKDGTIEIGLEAPYDGQIYIHIPRAVFHQMDKILGVV